MSGAWCSTRAVPFLRSRNSKASGQHVAADDQSGRKRNNRSAGVSNNLGVQPARRRRVDGRTTDERHGAGLLFTGG